MRLPGSHLRASMSSGLVRSPRGEESGTGTRVPVPVPMTSLLCLLCEAFGVRGLASPHPFLGAFCGMCYAGFAGTVAPRVMFPSGVVWPGMSRIMADMDQKDSTHRVFYWCSCTSRCISFGCGRPFCPASWPVWTTRKFSRFSSTSFTCPLCATTGASGARDSAGAVLGQGCPCPCCATTRAHGARDSAGAVFGQGCWLARFVQRHVPMVLETVDGG